MSATVATEEILIIETPERVPLHFALASIGNRFLACAIDHAIQWLALILILLAVAHTRRAFPLSSNSFPARRSGSTR